MINTSKIVNKAKGEGLLRGNISGFIAGFAKGYASAKKRYKNDFFVGMMLGSLVTTFGIIIISILWR